MISFSFIAVLKHTSCQNETSKDISDFIEKILIGVGNWDDWRTAQFVPAPAAGVSRADEQILILCFLLNALIKQKKYLLKQFNFVFFLSMLSIFVR